MGSPYSSEVRSGSHGELAVNVVAIAMKSRNFDEEQNYGDEGSDRCKHGNDNQGESYHADDRGNSGQIESPEGRSLPLPPCIMTLGGMEFAASTVVAADEEGKEEDEEEVDCQQQDPRLLGRAKAKSPTQAQAETPAARSPSEVKTVRSVTSDYDAESLFVPTPSPSPSPEVDVNLGLPAPALPSGCRSRSQSKDAYQEARAEAGRQEAKLGRSPPLPEDESIASEATEMEWSALEKWAAGVMGLSSLVN